MPMSSAFSFGMLGSALSQEVTEDMEEFGRFLSDLQDRIVDSFTDLEGPEGKKFDCRDWSSSKGDKIARGRVCVVQNGRVFERGSINHSEIRNLPASQGLIASMLDRFPENVDRGKDYLINASGLSLIMHPLNPYCPTVHMNYRFFELVDSNTGKIVERWYGGGCDLTPYYLFTEDAAHFHREIKRVCDKYSPYLYIRFKSECDGYFYIEHRKEHRGIGGIFFDYQRPTSEYDQGEFVRECGNVFLQQYLPIARLRCDTPYGADQVRWQRLRRGRYVEFNLVCILSNFVVFRTPYITAVLDIR